MKSKVSTILKVMTALVLAVLMMVGSVSNVVGAVIGTSGFDGGSVLAASAEKGLEIAENANSSEEADADAPDLSGFEENEIVRGMKDDLASTGAKADLAKTGATGHTIYMCPDNLGWSSYTKFKVFVKDDDSTQNYSTVLTKCPGTIAGKDIYTADIYEDNGGWRIIEFWAVDPSNDSILATYDSRDRTNWTFSSGVEGKVYNGYSNSSHHWDTPSWDREDVYVAGSFNGWNTSTTKMTAVGANDYTATVALDSSDTFKFYVSGYDQKYWGHGSAGFSISESVWGSDLNHANGGQNIKAPAISGTYTLHFDPSAKKAYAVLVSQPTTTYYLTGWLNGVSTTTTDNTRKFTESATTGIYTLTWTPTADHDGYQYVTIFDGTNAWHPTSHKSGTGTAAGTTPDTSPGNDNKWMVGAAANQTVTFTWNTTGAAPVLSWTVAGSGSSGTLTSYKVLYGMGSSVTQLKVMNGVDVYQTGTNEYTVNFSPVLGTTLQKNGEYYIAISKSDAYTDILGGGAQNNGNAGNYETKDGSKYFSTTQIQSYNYTVNQTNWKFYYAHIKLQNNPSGLKFVVTNPYSDSDYKVHYDYYASATAYSEEGGGDTAKSVVVYAKDGAAPINWDSKTSGGASDVTASATKYNYAAIATTTISQINGAAPAAGAVTTVDCGTSGSDTYRSQYQTATVETGKSIQITTTIADHLTWRSRYYVRGWCINGVTYTTTGAPGVNTTPNANGTYTMTYTIPAKTEANYLEITPIYYLQTNTNCITFYLEGFDEKIQTIGGWGNTPYIYPFYGNNDNVDNSFGCYPGQPMVYADGKYSIEIPMKNLLIDSDRTKHNQTDIKGITISNGYADHVHRNLVYKWTAHDNDADHKQTYDYDDFYKIYKECTKNSSGTETGAPNSIIFRIIDESTTYNRSTYGGSLSGARVVATKSSLTSTDLSNIDNGNGWELLTNRYGDPIDIFGTKVTAPATVATSMDDNALRVVSTGYNANIAGDYGTAWKVYKNNSTSFDLIQDSTNGRYAAPPSIFLLRGDASGYDAAVAGVGYPSASHSVTGVGSYTDDINKYVGIYKAAKEYAGKPVYITYEKNTQDTRSDATGTGAYRVDGRWYYTHSDDKVQSVVEIETKNKSTGNWVKDTFDPDNYATTTGSTGNKVEFSNHSRQSESVDNDGQHTITFTATPGPGYEFDSWWIKYSDTNYVKIEGAGATHTMTATASDTLVARFLPASSGELTIKHTKQGTGEGTIDMDVKVYTDNTRGTVVTGGTFIGNYVNIPSTIISNNPEHLNYYIEVTLKATPKYDGTVSSFTYDKFNANPSSGSAITATENKSATPATSTFGFTISQLYLGDVSLDTTELNYVSIIDAEDHFYEFTYSYKDRDKADKSYTTRGTIKLADYKTYVGDTDHELDAAFVKAKAPFESNFLKNNTLTVPAVSYTDGTKTFSVTATFNQTDSLPEYTVKFMLPYEYYTVKNTEGENQYKQYTVKPNSGGSKVYDDTKAAFELKAKYDQFVTVDATIEQAGSQTSVSKVTDATDVNHVGNDFFTAPEQLVSSDGSTTYYFQYWQIQRLADKDQASAPVVSKIYFPDLNYRIYGDYYIEPKYSTNAADWWHNTYINSSNSTDSSILYLGDSRNQWNLNGNSEDSASSDVASDKIYSDFMLAFNDKGAELKGSSAVKIGMIIERVVDNSGTTKKWATGSADVSDMNYYKTKNYGDGYDEATVKTAIADDLNSNNRANASNIGRSGCVGVDLSTANLNNKNYIETNYYVFSQYGQKVEAHSIEFATDNEIDNYVYRAYAVIKGTDGNWYVSDAAYFCTRYTANLKYSE